MNSEITGVILAGGKSSRFGSNKAFAFWKDKNLLIENVLLNLTQIFPKTLIVAKDSSEYLFINEKNVRIVEDAFCDFHSLGGLYSGLLNAPTDYIFVCGCDMPFIKAELIFALFPYVKKYDAVIPCFHNNIQPLCGIYSKKCIGVIEAMIEKNHLAINKLFRKVNTFFLLEDEVRKYDPEGLSFFDIDTVEDYIRAKNLIQGRSLFNAL